ncbi:MAG: TonB-dependent receptor [Deltaproteobacteria bacterium]|nr:TonB-dependent receptor [Deltaproteobacteria bacterium]
MGLNDEQLVSPPPGGGPRGAAWIVGLIVLLWPGVGFGSETAWVAFLHTPPVAQHAEADLVLVGSVIGRQPGEELVVRYRGEGEAWREVPVKAGWADESRAVVRASELKAPWIEYYVVSRRGSSEVAIFASAEAPRRIPVVTEARIQGGEGPQAGPTLEELRAAGRKELSAIAREAVVTSATLRAQTVTRAPAIVSSISRREIEAMGARTLVDVLDRIPGLTVSRDVQGFYRVSVRGIRSDPEVLLLLDGHRLGNLYDGRNLYELPVAGVERVEVIRGPGAALFGAGAFLAVINVVPSEALGIQGLAGFDTFAVGRSHVGLGLPVGEKGRVRFEADVKSGRGYHSPIIEDAFGGDEGDPAGAIDDHHRLVHGGVHGRHPFSDGSVFDWSLRALYQDRGALLGSFDTAGPRSELSWMVGLFDVGYQRPLGEKMRLRLSLTGDLQSISRTFELAPAGYELATATFEDGILEERHHVSDGISLQAAADVELFEGNSLTFGLGAAREALDAWDYRVNFDAATGAPLESPATPEGVTFPAGDAGLTQRIALGVFAQDLWTLVPSLDLTAGVRGDVFLGGVGRDDPLAEGKAGSTFAVTPRVGLVFQPTDPWTFKALFATAFRVPTFEELTSVLLESSLTRGQFEGDPTLEPVRIQTAEVSAEHRLASGKNQIRLRANAFFNRFLDRIEAVDETGVINQLSNRALPINVFGAEGGGRIDFSARDRVKVEVAWFRAFDTNAPSGLNLLTDTPQLKMVVQTELGLGPLLDLHLAARFGSERRNNARSKLEALHRFRIQPYALVDATLRTRPLGGHLVLEFTLRNALDSPRHDDVPRPDRVTGLLPGPGLSGELTLRGSF